MKRIDTKGDYAPIKNMLKTRFSSAASTDTTAVPADRLNASANNSLEAYWNRFQHLTGQTKDQLLYKLQNL